MTPNPLKQKIKNGELVLGSVAPAFTPHAVSTVCNADIDFLWMDIEHSPYGAEALDIVPILARQRGVAPMVRVAWNDPAHIKKAFDAGAVAVMVPQVDTPEQAAQAVSYTYYAPKGKRGVSPLWPLVAGEDFNETIKMANDEVVLVLQLESLEAYNHIDEIKKIPDIDVLFVGPLDLSASVGRITETGSTEVQEIMQDVPKRLEGTGIAAGTTLGALDEIQEKISWGYRYMNVGSPLAYGVQVLQDHLNTLRDKR